MFTNVDLAFLCALSYSEYTEQINQLVAEGYNEAGILAALLKANVDNIDSKEFQEAYLKTVDIITSPQLAA